MNEDLYYVILSAVVGLGVTFLSMPVLLRFCRMRGFYDLPGGRKVHHDAVPRLGGVLFMPAMLVSLAVVLWVSAKGLQGVLTLKVSSVLMAVGAFLIYIIGTVDDLIGMKAKHKFMVQLVAALLMPFCWLHINNFYGLFGLYELPMWFSYPFTVFVILLIVNSINLIDGIDGLASGLCFCILTAYVILYLQIDCTLVYAVGAAGLSGTLVAFFCFNMWGKAEKGTKTFMGDSGSLFLGYALAYLSIKYAMDNPAALPDRNNALMVSYTLMIVPTFDVIRVALCRLYRGKPVFEADKSHIHHMVMAAGFSMHQAWAVILGLFFFFCVMNGVLARCGVADTWIVVIDVAVFCLFHWGLHRRISKKSL
ncbi:MAG: undecaprenyl/decaprenyl-phosphate alpha-N-acetylglucosaminyl 1-phosphate transferase [Paraprevotella sp.]|nr:undecaprenyl/decaprenyl-phosphate alpha-N-acetylglucosaminyl 1-phosphate transferase [Paraprevotella sp.]